MLTGIDIELDGLCPVTMAAPGDPLDLLGVFMALLVEVDFVVSLNDVLGLEGVSPPKPPFGAGFSYESLFWAELAT